ncbi:MAG: hypothetical protein E7671_06520 [Ruminococcaceae bacterium]|nr:hypothetical protein [Oscillospiraceae bacterium]
MSKFDEFMSGAKNVAKRAANETVKLTDITSTKVKIKAEQARLLDRYERLGKEAESYLRAADELPEQIASALDEIDKVNAKIKSLEKELTAKKAKYEKKKPDEESAEEAEK